MLTFGKKKLIHALFPGGCLLKQQRNLSANFSRLTVPAKQFWQFGGKMCASVLPLPGPDPFSLRLPRKFLGQHKEEEEEEEEDGGGAEKSNKLPSSLHLLWGKREVTAWARPDRTKRIYIRISQNVDLPKIVL
jgi:hypothetical protein